MSWDAIIVGGGPAGAAAAMLLARWGHRVRVLTRTPRYGIAESLPPSIRRLLLELDLQDAVDAAPFYRSRGNTVWWGPGDGRTEMFPDGATGYQVERPAFDRLLLDAADSAGATVVRDATVRSISIDENGESVRFDAGGASATARASWVLDCSGRAGVLARQGFRRPERGFATLALYAVWERDGWALPDETHTLVESYERGWGWSIPISPTLRYVTVMVDPAATGRGKGGERPLDEIYHAELDRTSRLRDLVHDAALRDSPKGLSASPYTSATFGAPGWLLVGDAGSFIDPLSSFGVKKALASAWLAAVVVHTALTDAGMQGPALEFFQAREREAYAQLTRQAAGLFEEGARWHSHPFWSARAGAESDDLPTGEPDVDALRNDPAVLAAFERLKQLPSIALRPAAGVELVTRPLVRDHRIVLADHVKSAWTPQGLRYLRGVNLPRVLELALTCAQVPDVYEAYNRVEPWATLPDLLGVLSVLLAKGVLVQGETTVD